MLFYFLGGPSCLSLSGYIERTYYGFSTHDILYFGFQIILGGTWQPSDSFSLYFDGSILKTFYPHQAVSLYSTASCSTAYNTVLYSEVGGKVLHTNSLLTFRLSWGFQGPGSPFIAIKDLTISFATKTPTDLEEAYLMVANTALPYSSACTVGQYYDTITGSCEGCDPVCQSCFGKDTTQCYRTLWHGAYDGTTSFGCFSDCYNCWGPANNQCKWCPPLEVLDQTNVCQSSCTLPYVQYGDGSIHACLLPCASNEYRLWNNTCGASCNPPLVSTLDPNGNTCSYPCGLSINSFLSWDGTCLSTCLPPHYVRDDNNYRFCDACQPGYFMYQNGACLPSCDPLFTITLIGSSNFCNYPCLSSQYLFEDGSCLATCPTPYAITVKMSFNFCNTVTDSDISSSPRSTDMDGIDKIQEGLSQVLTSCVILAIFLNIATPTATIYPVIIVNMLQYLKFLDILYPPRLQYMLDSSLDISLNIVTHFPKSLEVYVPNHTIPRRFARYNIRSSFLVNFWSSGLTFLILLLVVFLVQILEHFTSKYHKLNSLIRRVRQELRWNLCLITFIPYYKNIVVFTSLELRTVHLNAFLPVLSLLYCIFMNVVAIVVIIKIIKVIKTAWDSYKTQSNKPSGSKTFLAEIQTSRTLKDYEVVYKDYKHHSLLQQSFLFYTVVRLYVFFLIIGYMFDHPVAQMVLILIINLVMLAYFSLIRPHQRKIQLAECLVGEVALLIVNICTLALSILDTMGAEAIVSRVRLGNAIIGINLSLIMGSCLILLIKIGLQLSKMYKHMRNRRLARKVKPEKDRVELIEVKSKELQKEDGQLMVDATPKIQISSATNIAKPLSSGDLKPLLCSNPIFSPSSQSRRSSHDIFSDSRLIQDHVLQSSNGTNEVSPTKQNNLIHQNSCRFLRNRESLLAAVKRPSSRAQSPPEKIINLDDQNPKEKVENP